VAVLCMFYGLAVVVEEFFVPALNTMCVKYGIPDDVAGATFMAAGASSPEMFAAFLSMFVTHSALGVGTIIGSELFNHLIISAGSIYYSRSGTIKCDPRLVGRESFFYLLALGMLMWSLSTTSKSDSACSRILEKTEPEPKSVDPNGAETLEGLMDSGCICVEWFKPLAFVLCYAFYALVCAKYQHLIQLFCPVSAPFQKEEAWQEANSMGDTVLAENLRASRGTYAEPLDNFINAPKKKSFQSPQETAILEDDSGGRPTLTSANSLMTTQDNPAFGKLQDMEQGAKKTKSFKFNIEGGDGGRQGRSGTLVERSMSTAGRAVSTAGKITTELGGYIVQSLAPSYIVDGSTAELFEVKSDPSGTMFSCYLWKQSKWVPSPHTCPPQRQLHRSSHTRPPLRARPRRDTRWLPYRS